MTPVIFVVFPPGSGGNHLRNMIVSLLGKDREIDLLYTKKNMRVHAKTGPNLQLENIQNAIDHPDGVHVLHGHFGEIMSYRDQIRSITNKKFVVLSLNTADDRKLLNQRCRHLNYPHAFLDENYFNFEQVFLYESFMYHLYFQVPMEHIISISITEWLARDIDTVLDRLSWLLCVNINKTDIARMHCLWLEDNNL